MAGTAGRQRVKHERHPGFYVRREDQHALRSPWGAPALRPAVEPRWRSGLRRRFGSATHRGDGVFQSRLCRGLSSAGSRWSDVIGSSLRARGGGLGRAQIAAFSAPRAPGITALSRVDTAWRRRAFLWAAGSFLPSWGLCGGSGVCAVDLMHGLTDAMWVSELEADAAVGPAGRAREQRGRGAGDL